MTGTGINMKINILICTTVALRDREDVRVRNKQRLWDDDFLFRANKQMGDNRTVTLSQ